MHRDEIGLCAHILNSSKMMGNFPGVLNFNRFFSNSIGSSVTNGRFSPIIDFDQLWP